MTYLRRKTIIIGHDNYLTLLYSLLMASIFNKYDWCQLAQIEKASYGCLKP
jgi:hypothetical protein